MVQRSMVVVDGTEEHGGSGWYTEEHGGSGWYPLRIVSYFVNSSLQNIIRSQGFCSASLSRADLFQRDETMPNKILWYEHWNYPKKHVYQF